MTGIRKKDKEGGKARDRRILNISLIFWKISLVYNCEAGLADLMGGADFPAFFDLNFRDAEDFIAPWTYHGDCLPFNIHYRHRQGFS